ncbi:MAG: carboxypeptidase-like regulatory domain-containing protein [Muribaculaceae bacterium]|nr:carboxypeptidase-like regulatory domain-containing protein [Muribaculaceae bacterium]
MSQFLRKISLRISFLTLLLGATTVSAAREIEVDTLVFSRDPKVLDEVVVKVKKEKYSKHNNPAVELMERVRAARENTDPFREPFYSYDSYDRITLALNDFDKDGKSALGHGRLTFMTEYVDTAPVTGKRLLNLSVKERLATRLHSEAGGDKEVVRGRRSVGIDQAFDQQNIRGMLEDALREIDVYQNDITLMQNRFVSPLSKIGADYYMYFITDTVAVNGVECIRLTFRPHNAETFGFQGNLFIEKDDPDCFVRRVDMRVPRRINLNYVDNLILSQTYTRDSAGNRNKVSDDLSMEIQLIPGTQPFYARRVTAYDNFSYVPREDLREFYDRLGSDFEVENPQMQDDGFWESRRLIPLSAAEKRIGGLMPRLREIPFFYWAEKVLVVLVGGYWGWKPDSPVLLGPVNTLISSNTIEGVRLRAGGMTTAYLNPHWFGRGFVAYGTKDRKWKYSAELEYSILRKNLHSREFPVHSLRATYLYDLDMIGQHYLFTNADNVFLSFKRMKSDLATYRHMAKIEYTLELRNNFSVNAWFRHERQEASPWLRFVDGYGVSHSHYNQAAFGLTLRYAPGEKFAQQKTVRLPINMDAPIFQLTHEFGPKGMAGSAFTLNRTELSVQKRFWFSAFGYTDIILKGGMIWSGVQYPALMWPNANLSYTIQPESYSLMSPMEFANDKYASLDLTYWGNGVLFNRIPGFKRLKLREVITFKGLMGGLSGRNNPACNESLFRFPGDAIARVMTSTPYMELGAGIDNILTILRVDYVWRLSYRDTPGTDRHGVRISLHFSF